MRVLAVAAAIFAGVVTAQLNNAISVPEGQSTLDVVAGEPLTIDWTNPSSGTVTIKLQQVPITPDSGIVLASGIDASDLTATLQIPDAADVNSFQYTLQIVDDTDPDNYNFSPNFGIQGATGTATGSVGTASATGSTRSAASTGTASVTSSETDTESSSASATDSSRTASTAAATTTTTESTSSRSSSTATSSAAAETTSAPSSNDNGASGLKIQGGLFALAAGAAIAVM